MANGSQEVSFVLTKDDFWHFLLYVYARRRSRRYKALAFYSLVMIVAAIALQQTVILIAAVLFAVFILALAYLSMWLAASKSSKSLQNRGNHIVSIAQDGIRHKNEQSDTLTRWSAVKAIGSDAYNVYLQLDNPGRVFVGLIIPKRAFETSATIEQFLGTARDYWQSQKQN